MTPEPIWILVETVAELHGILINRYGAIAAVT